MGTKEFNAQANRLAELLDEYDVLDAECIDHFSVYANRNRVHYVVVDEKTMKIKRYYTDFDLAADFARSLAWEARNGYR